MLGKFGDGRAEKSPRAGNGEIAFPGPAGWGSLTCQWYDPEGTFVFLRDFTAADHLRIQSTAQFSMARRMQQTSFWFMKPGPL